jgi:hypothetical protein
MRARVIEDSNFLEKKNRDDRDFRISENLEIIHHCEDKNGYQDDFPHI